MRTTTLLLILSICCLAACKKEDSLLGTTNNALLADSKWRLIQFESSTITESQNFKHQALEQHTIDTRRTGYDGTIYYQDRHYADQLDASNTFTDNTDYIRSYYIDYDFNLNGSYTSTTVINTTSIEDYYEDADTSYTEIRSSEPTSTEVIRDGVWYVIGTDEFGYQLMIDQSSQGFISLENGQLTISSSRTSQNFSETDSTTRESQSIQNTQFIYNAR